MLDPYDNAEVERRQQQPFDISSPAKLRQQPCEICDMLQI